MYTRSYGDELSDIIIPEKYGGTSFTQGIPGEEKKDIGSTYKNPWEADEIHSTSSDKIEDGAMASATPSKLPFIGFLSGIFKNESLSLQKIGKEELLILATAAFLFFSREGDKECAIMLLLLLFIS